MTRLDILAEIRDLKAAPEVTPETVKAAERFLASLERLNDRLRRARRIDASEIEGLCVGRRR